MKRNNNCKQDRNKFQYTIPIANLGHMCTQDPTRQPIRIEKGTGIFAMHGTHTTDLDKDRQNLNRATYSHKQMYQQTAL